MKKLIYLISVALILLLYACNCDKKYSCPALSNDALSWLPQQKNDTVKFINGAGNRFKFIINQKSITPAYEKQACKPGEIGCSCDYHCEANGHLAGYGDSSVNGQSSYYININEATESQGNYKSEFTLTYSVFDFFGKQINILYTKFMTGDSLLNTIELGNHTYTNVYVQSVDTLSSFNANRRIWKAYFTKSNGIVGFWDRQSHTLYYRE